MPARLRAHLRIIRGLLRRLNYRLSPPAQRRPEPFDPVRLKQAEEALRKLPALNSNAEAYLDVHLGRLARTLALAPPPQTTSRVLELGCYMQITPWLQRLCGYREVRGAFFGKLGRTDRKTILLPDGGFECYVDHFDVERDRFPYPDDHFDLVIAGEIIEHLTFDPMHMMLEARRILRDGGFLLLTTPNAGSLASVAKALEGRLNPQIYSLYKRPGGEDEIGHFREYTMYELGATATAAGFEVRQLFTSFIERFLNNLPLLRFLEENGYDPENRGEQSWCMAMKRASLPVDRYPYFLYSP